ncbi:hypothetical protein CTAYLR_006540 [Chrysophaeum taylorii]|uniref:Methyltransferase domain-containing protein n=1 Tax=Chrysophaeum taylorii TaxID=2483200 RepID=A0AAD7XMP9_9STRA|nr:hypothetical protein CTAYLR_006540 [Chrysophaeum taylorii]
MASSAINKYECPGYWGERYAADDSRFEWFVSFASIRPLLGFVRRGSAVLDMGCGTSLFLADLRRDGHRGRLVGVDIVEKAVRALRRETRGLEIEVYCDDVRALRFGASTFDVVVDKGTIDAMICGGAAAVQAACAEVSRVLRVGGRFVVCSHHLVDGMDDWLRPVIDGLTTTTTTTKGDQPVVAWGLDVHALEGGGPTIYIFTKHRASPRGAPSLKMAFHEHAG